MTTNIESVAGGIHVTGEMTVYTASQIKQPLLDAIAVGPVHFELNLSGVSEFDTAGMQLLLLAQREALACARKMRLGAHSEIVREVLTLCGARTLLLAAAAAEVRA